jgi:Photosynthetic reaction centre cytochrome C subunit
MSLLRGRLLILGILIAPAAIGAASQDRGAGDAAAISHVASNYKPTNLKVLPKDTSTDELNTLMYQYQRYLGQPCTFCHAENPETKQIDFASDDNPMKNTARTMIRMTTDLNTKYLAQLGDRRYAAPFTCGNCHRGQIQPPPFE